MARDDACVLASQSGETADTLAALKHAEEKRKQTQVKKTQEENTERGLCCPLLSPPISLTFKSSALPSSPRLQASRTPIASASLVREGRRQDCSVVAAEPKQSR